MVQTTPAMSHEDIDLKQLTPMMAHWYSVKKKYPEHLIAYRMGDFYEFFYEDAERISNLLGLTLTKRKIGNDTYPLAGIPHHAGNYLNNLVNMGETVVLVEQLEDPATVKGRIVKRGVVRILSPGTVIESDMLKSNDNNYLASMVKTKKGYGISFADISTGEFVTTEFSNKEKDPMEKLLSIFAQYDPVEVIIPSELKKDEKLFLLITDLTKAIIKPYEDYVFSFDEAYIIITRHFKLTTLDSFSLEGTEMAIQAAGGLLAFLKETQRDVIPNIFKINRIKEKDVLHLDYITQRNLELVSSLWEKGKDITLYSMFNRTHTPMGARLLKRFILQPLIDSEQINERLNIVQKFRNDIFLRSDLREELKVVGDLERYINRVNFSARTSARDLINIKASLEVIPRIKASLEKVDINEISRFLEKIDTFDHVREIIEKSIKDDPPTSIKEGNIIKEGYNGQVDELRDILKNGKKYVLEYEDQERKRLNLTSGLKVGHNNILGYYIQITLNTLKTISKIPEDYIERSTLKNAKRYTTEKLKLLEEKVISAEEKINNLEYELFCEIREKIVGETVNILETSKNIAIIDVLACFAEISERNNYCRPIINNKNQIIIKEGRHPVVEQINISEQFIPNDCFIDMQSDQVLIITGPNMAGKSTFLRQVALTCLIAQMGCFVPARAATIGIIDQIFTRIGASDDLARKLSTFMIEMTETAKILNYATPKSLIIIDELGRGTSTSDGQSIAMATLEKLHDMGVKTLFSTHYHQLTEIKLPRIRNYHLDIIENEDGSINFVRKLREGAADKSYGIHVAKLAGIPDDVIIRAFEILDNIEAKDPFKATVKQNGKGNDSIKVHDVIIEQKKNLLSQLNQELNIKKLELRQCDENLNDLGKEIQHQNKIIEELTSQISKLKENLRSVNTLEKKERKAKKTVQTSFFRPVIKKEKILDKEIVDIIEDLEGCDINNLTPVDAMKKIIELKEKLANLELNDDSRKES